MLTNALVPQEEEGAHLILEKNNNLNLTFYANINTQICVRYMPISSLPLRLQMITMQTVAMAIAMTAHPTVTVVRIAIKGTSESPEFDHFEPNSFNYKVIKKML